MKKNIPSITTQLAAGSTTSPYFLTATMRLALCRDTCADTPPVFTPSISVVSINDVGTGQYLLTLNMQGVVSYTPCGACQAVAVNVNETFTVAVASDATPTSATVSTSTTINTIEHQPCHQCGSTLVSVTPLTLTIA